MRIGIEAQRLLRLHKHGMDIVALELIKALQRIDNHNEYFLFVRPDEDRDCVPRQANFTLVEVPGSNYVSWEQVALPRAIRPYQLDLLHCTANTAPLRCPVPLVLTLHDIIFLENNPLSKGSWYQRLGNLYRRWNVPRVLTQCERIVTVSDFERERIVGRFSVDPARVVAVHNGVSPRFQEINDAKRMAEVRVQYSLPPRFMLFLGNTDPKKNVRGVLKAMLLLRQRDQMSLPLVITNVSPAYVNAVLSEINGQELADDIVLSGYVPNSVLPLVYNAATLFLCPSLRESFGLPILEAMACGTPVITSSSSAMPEVAGNAALLIDPEQPERIAGAIHQLKRNSALRHTLIRRGKRRAGAFSWQRTAEQTLRIYESVGQPVPAAPEPVWS